MLEKWNCRNGLWKPVDWEEGNKEIRIQTMRQQQTYENTVYRSATDAVYKINASKEKLTEKRIKNLRKLGFRNY